MEDLRQLLYYEIPGLILLIYLLILFHPVLLADQIQFEFLGMGISEIFLGLVGLAAIIALPCGFLLYQLYSNIEHEKYYGKREGIRIVFQILQKDSSLEKELEWWEKHSAAERNEVLDAFFYGNKEKKELTSLLGRFQRFYHSRRVVGIYAPLVAAFIAAILTFLLPIFPVAPVFVLITIVISVLLCFLRFTWEYLDDLPLLQYCLVYFFVIGVPIFLVTIFLSYELNVFICGNLMRIFTIPFLILLISTMAILPTHRSGFLRRWIAELEINIILPDIEKIRCKIRTRSNID